MTKDGYTQISILNALTSIITLSRLKGKIVKKKKRQCPLNTIIKSPDGDYYIVESSTYKQACNDYWLFLRPYVKTEGCFGVSLFEGKLSMLGFKIVGDSN